MERKFVFGRKKLDKRFVHKKKRIDKKKVLIASKQLLRLNCNMQKVFNLPMLLFVDDQEPVNQHPKLG